ncbi:MAG: sulfotransferase [Bacteroidia bacterium]|nr:sulfotransferase [Bacteroidia bacterium]
MKLPDFLVVGTARAGTTSLYYYLRQHPDIFLPALKEPCFFSFAGTRPAFKKGKFAFAVSDIDTYAKLFDSAPDGSARGDISTPYLYLYQDTIKNIFHYHPRASALKIIIILRNPADRAFSQYLWKVRDGRENLGFEEAITREKERMAEGYSIDYMYTGRGFYHDQVKAYLDHFEHVKVALFEDLRDFRGKVLQDFCRFLGIDDSFGFASQSEYNASYAPRWKLLNRLVTAESRTKFRILNQLPGSWRQGIKEQFMFWNAVKTSRRKLEQGTREKLVELFREDVEKLAVLIGRDLSHWLK